MHERRGEKADHNVGWVPRLIHVTVFSCLALAECDARLDGKLSAGLGPLGRPFTLHAQSTCVRP